MMEVDGICGEYSNPRAYAQSMKSIETVVSSNTKKSQYTNKHRDGPVMTAEHSRWKVDGERAR